MLSSISFIINVIFFNIHILHFLVKFIPTYYVHFYAVVNGIVFLISFSDHLLLVHGTITEFCVLILYPMTTEFISLNTFLMEYLGLYNITSSANSDNFTASFPIWMPFFFFIPSSV